MDVTPSEAKQDLLTRLLDEGMVQVMIDARSEGVDVPAHLVNDHQLRLNLSYRFNNHMALNASGIEATLTFKGEPYTCQIPWASVYLMVLASNEEPPYVFPSDMPEELVHLTSQLRDTENMTPNKQVSSTSVRPELKVLSQDTNTENESKPEVQMPEEKDDPPPRSRNHLRVVK